MTITTPTISQALKSLAEVHAENARLREEIAELRTIVRERALPEPLGPAPDFDTPLEDMLTVPCITCGTPTETDLCEDCDDRASLPCDAAE